MLGFGIFEVGQTTGLGLVVAGDQAGPHRRPPLLVATGNTSSTISPAGSHLAALATDRVIALTIVDLTNPGSDSSPGREPSEAGASCPDRTEAGHRAR
jgi:hypothetical protein